MSTIRKKITPPSVVSQHPAVEAFVSGAPDAAKPRARERKEKVELWLDPEDMARLDALAAETREKRAPFVRRIVMERLKGEGR